MGVIISKFWLISHCYPFAVCATILYIEGFVSIRDFGNSSGSMWGAVIFSKASERTLEAVTSAFSTFSIAFWIFVSLKRPYLEELLAQKLFKQVFRGPVQQFFDLSRREIEESLMVN